MLCSANKLLDRIRMHLKIGRNRQQSASAPTAELEAIARLYAMGNRCIRTSNDLQGCLDEILKTAILLSGADKGTLQILNAETDTLKIAAQEGFGVAFLSYFAEVRAGEPSCCGASLEAKTRVVVDDVSTSPLFIGKASQTVLFEAGVQAMQSTPLVSSTNALLGILTTHFAFPHRPSEWDLGLMDLLARQAADYLERKQAEQALWESESRYYQLVESLPIGVYTCDRSGKLDYFNDYAAKLLGCRPDIKDPAEKFCDSFRLYHPDGTLMPHNQTPVIEALRDGRSLRNGEFTIERADGTHVEVLVHIDPILDAAGNSVGVINAFIDVSERKQAEEQLTQSERTLMELIEWAPFGLYVVDSRFRIAMMNTGSQNGAFRNVRPVIGRDFAEALRILWPEEVAAEIMGHFRHTLDSGEPYYSPRFVHPRHDVASVESYEWELHRMTLPDGQFGVICYYYDSTALRAAESALRGSEERLALAASCTGIGLFEWEIQTGRVLWTEQHARLLGLATTIHSLEYSYRDWAERVHPDDLPRVEAELTRSVAEQIPYKAEYRVIWPDGSVHWLMGRGMVITNNQGQAEQMLGIIMDITANKLSDEKLQESESRLRESEMRFRTLVERIGDVFWISDPERGKLIYASQAFEAIWGLDLKQLYDHFEIWLESIHEEDRERVKHEFFMNVPLGQYDCEYRVVRPNGTIRWIRDHGKPLGIGNLVAGVAQDITERKQAEEILREDDRRKNQFLATLAHELRNPLAPISSGLHILKMPTVDSATVLRIHRMMERQVDCMVKLVDDLMDVSRITRGMIELHKESLDLSEVLLNAVETSRPLIDQKGHQFDIIIPSEPIILEADKIRLTQIITNLLNNAANYTPNGGLIKLSARREDSNAVVSVRDNGLGIPPEMQLKVFDMFTQVNEATNRPQGGLGIGLTLVQNLVYLHGGSIELKSEGDNQGTEFVVRLPLAGKNNHLAASDQAQNQPVNLSALRILVVDDIKDVADSLAMLLRQMAAEVEIANDGPAALDTLKTFQPSVVFLDIGMLDMDGYEVAQRIRKLPESKAMTLIALTGWGQEEDRLKSKEAGFDHHLIKPVNIHALKELFRNSVDC